MAYDEIDDGRQGLSRRQLLAGGAGLAGVLAGAGLLNRGEAVMAASVPGAGATGTASVGTATSGPVSGFLKLDKIAGESLDTVHKGEIDISSYGFGFTEQTPAAGSGAGAGRPAFAELSVTKRLDRATPLLLLASWKGQHIATGLLTLRNLWKDEPVEFLKIALTNILVSSVSDSSADEVPSETVTLNFSKIHVEYTYVDSAGHQQVYKAGWDLALSKPA